MLRLQGNLTNMQEQFPLYAFQDQTTSPISRFVALPTAAFITNLLNFEIFKAITQAGPVETAGNLIEVNLETLRTQKHPFMPHPLCRTCQHPEPRTQAQFLDTVRQLEQAEQAQTSSEGQDLFSEQVTPCFETRLGLFSSLDEGDLVQLPLSVCKAVVSNPMPQEQAENPPSILGFGFTFGTARKRAAQRACEIYAASLVDRRLLPSWQPAQTVGTGSALGTGVGARHDPYTAPVHETGADADQADHNVPATSFRTGKSPVPTIPAERFLSIIALTEVKEWTWATDLSTGQACLIPAPLVYPVLRGLSPLGDAGLGISSAMSWAEAIGRALLSVCRYLTLIQIEYAQKPYPQADPTSIPLSPEGTRLLHILEQMGASITIYDVTGPLQVPTFAICLGDQTVAYGTHIDVAQALRDGLEQAVLSKQLAGSPILVDHLPFTPALPPALRGTSTDTVGTGSEPRTTPTAPVRAPLGTSDASKEWPDLSTWLQEVLQMNGWRAFAVPLDHDPTLRQIHPSIVHVLVARN
jgi:bacteriocin biosynthesis cyclodehydratase domain-containing protein